MGITVVSPDDSVTEMMRIQLAGMAQQRAFRTLRLAEAQPETLQLSVPHPVFNLDLDQIDGDDTLQRVSMTAWRYFVTSGNEIVAATEATAKHRHGRAVFSSINEGPFVHSSVQALREADTWPEVQSGQYVIALLRVPSIYFVALWLRDAQGRAKSDVFVPLKPSPPGVEGGQRLGSAAMTRVLLSMKQSRRRATGDSN